MTSIACSNKTNQAMQNHVVFTLFSNDKVRPADRAELSGFWKLNFSQILNNYPSKKFFCICVYISAINWRYLKDKWVDAARRERRLRRRSLWAHLKHSSIVLSAIMNIRVMSRWIDQEMLVAYHAVFVQKISRQQLLIYQSQ